MRIPTHIVQKLYEDSGKEISTYLAKLQQLKLESLTSDTKEELLFGNFDETPIQFDMAVGRTYDFKGVKEVCIQTTNGFKMRVTVLLSILSNGIMLPPLFIFKRQKNLPSDLINKYAKECLIYSNANGWITEEILCDWLRKVWLNLNIASRIKPVLIFDKCRVHISAQVKDFLKEKNLLYEVLPAGTTGYLQPLDVSINKPIKDIIKQKFNTWFQQEGIKATNRTNHGYLRPPSFDSLIKWTLEACNSIKSDIISHSFKTTG